MNNSPDDRGPCRCCGRSPELSAGDGQDDYTGIDPCIGFLIPGVSHACCGHGDIRHCYVTLGGEPTQDVETIENHLTLRGTHAAQFLNLARAAHQAGGTLW